MIIVDPLNIYCPFRGWGEKPSPPGDDFSVLEVWRMTANYPTQLCIYLGKIKMSRQKSEISEKGLDKNIRAE
jgi:hypothetical protein